MRLFQRRNKEPYQPTPEEEAEIREAVREQVEEMLVGETFWGELSDGRPWSIGVKSYRIDEFRLTIDWE